MSRFTSTQGALGRYPYVQLADQARGCQLKVALHGATLLSLTASDGYALADAYHDADELQQRPSSRFAAMAPFANRIADASYDYDGQPHDMAPGQTGTDRVARHGFLRSTDYELVDTSADDQSAQLLLRSQVIRPGVFAGYPFAVDIEIRFVLDADGLTVEAGMHNVGDVSAPCFFGWHPYFRVGDTAVDGWELQVPAETLIVTDAGNIPLPGEQALVPVSARPELDFRQLRPIGSVHIDQGYTDLRAEADGRIRSYLRDPASGRQLVLWQEGGIVLVFTADTVARDVRRSVALEPMESFANAFNRDDCADAVRLEAGARRQFRFGVTLP
ncbi:aldose epimerase family protein [Frateuria aurantia]